MYTLTWQSATLKEGVFQDNLIEELQKTTNNFNTKKGTIRYHDDAKRKDGEIKFPTTNGDYYLTLEFKRDKTFDLLSNFAQVIHYEYQASCGGVDPLMENYGGIVISQSTIVFLEYCKIPDLFNELYAVFPNISTSAASKVYAESSQVQVIMEKYEQELRKACIFYHMDQYEYYTPIFEDIVSNLKARLN